ncbi:NACHT domain-containing protein [Pseudomonas subflava]|uniref:NACHT domain-containing protein n=1 Tax=Pseudomonas subflava TaxID=2952933 RepID=UPI002079EBE6|nr:hypothetical protein [Pseudomonas subflava]
MSYLFEQLGDERFQKLCQALIVSLYPDAQCFPVGQPDGGRDGQVRTKGAQTSDAIIFQVKYSKDPFSKTSREVIEGLISTEREKVNKLVAKGASAYHLMTNVAGTSHLECGSIDVVNKELSEAFGIDVYCWWRDDLDRRIDNFSEIKWSYPEILKATDLLGALVESKEDPDSVRRMDSLRSYMAHQARYDSQLKFKQVELERDIVDLFVDVPGCFYPPVNTEQKHLQEYVSHVVDAFPDDENEDNSGFENDPEGVDGTLVFPLHRLMVSADVSQRLKCVVVEGAPGQGKSTVTQYLCQVNRLLLLNKAADIRRVSPLHIPSDVRIPFRVDLRDYANWVSGKNPFAVSDASQSEWLPDAPVLEGFISSQIKYCTGSNFTVDDFLAVVKASQVLIVLDGFDEVADVVVRNRIVDEISYAADRISQSAISAQIIVTSRPTAFANSPGFSKAEWQHLKILPLFKNDIKKYAVRWLEGRGADAKECQEVLGLLAEKLGHSHVRDLARNPMQLAILLALISVQGASLPDKRTSLYDDYIKIFLNRETEKSLVVREHRELLVQIHRYLAWVLQSEAEEKSESGNITETRLRALLREFLDRAGHPADLVDSLFSGMVERVVVLVSRVQGTFEFEVQPLREYFAARYLYDTAPYAPAGSSKRGALPERFDAISRNFYWLNVSRFYAGCYSSGELSSILDGLDEVANSKDFKDVAHAARFGIFLLKDYVFSQSPRLAQRLLDKIIDSHRFRLLLADGWTERSANEPILLPNELLRNSLVRKCVETLVAGVAFDARYALARIISLNSSSEHVDKIWVELSESGISDDSLCSIGIGLGVFERSADEEIFAFVRRFGAFLLVRMLTFQRYSLFGNKEMLKLYEERALSQGAGYFYIGRSRVAKVPFVAIFFHVLDHVGSDYFWDEFSADEGLYQFSQYGELDFYNVYKECVASGGVVVPEDFAQLWAVLESFMESHAGSQGAVLAFSALMDEAIKCWGQRWLLLSSSICFAQSTELGMPPAVDINDVSVNPLERARYARGAWEDLEWWRRQFSIVSTSDLECKRFLWACAQRWMSTSVLVTLSSEISEFLKDIPVFEVVEPHSVMRHSKVADELAFDFGDFDVNGLSETIICVLLVRARPDSRYRLWETKFESCDGLTPDVLELSANILLERAALDDVDCWEKALLFTRSAYALGRAPSMPEALGDRLKVPICYSREVCSSPSSYPLGLVALAERVLSAEAGASVKPVASIARQDDWSFLDD